MKDFKAEHTEHTQTILVVSYGNRAYEDTVKELKDYVTAKGFSCIAAITSVAEHSIMHQFAAGHPDKEDEEQLVQFAKQISNKMENKRVVPVWIALLLYSDLCKYYKNIQYKI